MTKDDLSPAKTRSKIGQQGVLKEKFERTSLFLFVYGMFVRGAGVRRFGGGVADLSA